MLKTGKALTCCSQCKDSSVGQTYTLLPMAAEVAEKNLEVRDEFDVDTS